MKMFERIRNVLDVTWRRCFNLAGTSCLASDLMKMFDRSRNIWQVIWRRVYKYQERLASHAQKMLQRIRNIWQVTWRRCCNVSGTFCNLQKTLQRRCWSGSLRSNPCSIPVPDPYHSDLESFTFCCETVECVRIFPFFCNRKARRARRARGARGERLASHLTKMLRRSRNVLPVCAQEQERYYPTPPHPSGNWSWKSSAARVSAGQQERWWGCCAWLHVPAPCPQVLPQRYDSLVL